MGNVYSPTSLVLKFCCKLARQHIPLQLLWRTQLEGKAKGLLLGCKQETIKQFPPHKLGGMDLLVLFDLAF